MFFSKGQLLAAMFVVVFWKCLLLPTFCALTCASRTVLFSWEREGVVGGWAKKFLEVFAAAVTP